MTGGWIFRRVAFLAGCCLAASSCAHNTALPLPERPALGTSVQALRHAGVSLSAPLRIDEVATLAVQNNPELAATRAQHGVAQAQLMQAGMPPNPQVNGSLLPLVAGPATTLAYNAGMSIDVKALITLTDRRDAARASGRQIDAQILWQEWQTVGQARLLVVDLIEGERNRQILTATRDLLAGRSARSQRALAAGNATIATVTPDLVALQAARAQVFVAEQVLLAKRHQLNALLGLAPDVALPLAGRPDLPAVDAEHVLPLLPSLADRRPDLVALRLGYAAEDAKLRGAILAQFPNLAFGVAGGSDNSNIRNVGPQITLELPIFDRNQGNIAIERATRRQLRDEYAARLAATDGQVRAMLTEMAQLERQLDAARADLAASKRVTDQADAAYAAGNLDERGYVDLVSARLAKEQEIVALEQSLLEQRVAIATLIGAGMRPIALPAEKPRT